MLQQVQREWSELRSELQVRRSLRTEAPADGGPLNSAVLVQRMLDTMQATSPGYLRHFIDSAIPVQANPGWRFSINATHRQFGAAHADQGRHLPCP